MQTGDGSIVGQKGVKYGLQKPVVKGAPAAQAPPRRPAAANIFGEESDEEDVETQIKRQADKKRAAAKVWVCVPCIRRECDSAIHGPLWMWCQYLDSISLKYLPSIHPPLKYLPSIHPPFPIQVQQQYEAALAEDASVFDYDGVYDSLQQQKIQPKQAEKIERKSRYIAQVIIFTKYR